MTSMARSKEQRNTYPAGSMVEVRERGGNVSRKTEAGCEAAMTRNPPERWLDENRAALMSSNLFVERHELPLARHRAF